MAKNKNLDPVESESSDEEETDASSDEETETTFKKPTNTVPNKPSSTPIPDSSDEESDSDSDSQPQTTTTTTNNKITTVETHQPDSSDESESDSEPKPSVTPSKRLAEPTTKAAFKKPKIVTQPEKKVPESNSKKVLFQRLWSDEDEIVILNGMIEYEAKNNVSPTSDLDSFLGYIKKDLHVDVSKTQLLSKIRKLKKRYENNKGKDKNLMKPHEKATFEFSEKLWGGGAASSGVVNGSVVRNTSKKGKNVKKEEVPNGGSDKKKDVVMEASNGGLKKALVRKMSSSFGLRNEEKLLRIGAEMFGGEEKIAGLEEWKKLEREGMELSLKELDVKRAKMRLVLDAME